MTVCGQARYQPGPLDLESDEVPTELCGPAQNSESYSQRKETKLTEVLTTPWHGITAKIFLMFICMAENTMP